MNLTPYIQLFIFVPLLGFFLSLFIKKSNENVLSRIAFFTAGTHLIISLVFVGIWLFQGMPTLNLPELELFASKDYVFLIDFFFDGISAVYLLVGSILTFLITIYSRYYLHRELSYKYFFNTILFFFVGYNFTIFSGNFETLFIGWEILGMSSFMLIAFYSDRYFPVRNAVKVFSIYRIGDVGILLAMWASHHLWHENITFLKLNNYELVHEHLQGHTGVGIFISLMILLAASAKSAQLPFSSWLPKAMEGPTPSSAIFYGSLSVHFGVFILLRTYPFWEGQIYIRILIGLIGLTTAIVASTIGRVQSSIKTQIAYASIAQIGIMFIEVAAGLHILALLHFAGNAFLRTYQLLVSPSVVSYLIREQFYTYEPRRVTIEDTLPKRIEYSFYLLSLKEFNLDLFLNKGIFEPLKKLGHKLNFLNSRNLLFIFIPTYILGILLLYNHTLIPETVKTILPVVFATIALLMVLKAFGERQSPILAWFLVLLNHFWIALAISHNEHFDLGHTLLYLSGIIPAALLGYVCLEYLSKKEKAFFSLNGYYGHSFEYPKTALLFFLACLGLMGFPISTSFIGEDLIISHIYENDYILASLVSFTYILGGIALVRAYARIFLGPHVKTYHETPVKSA